MNLLMLFLESTDFLEKRKVEVKQDKKIGHGKM